MKRSRRKLTIQLDPRQDSPSAVRTILLELLTTIERSSAGVIDDTDPDYLHDFRVACRRTRSALSQLEGVFSSNLIEPFKPEFKWLSAITGPQRDLDVFLLEIPVYRSMLPEHARQDYSHLESLLESNRALAHLNVVRGLKSERFRELIGRWRTTLEAPPTPAENNSTPSVVDLASHRIAKAHRRILKRSRRFGGAPTAEELHRLRIDAKKLRYLLEFFKSLYPTSEITDRIRELKKLQDILGGFNDMEVQWGRLIEIAETLNGDPEVPANTVAAIGRLVEILQNRQEEHRRAFHGAFAEFAGECVTAAYRRLFNTEDSRRAALPEH